MVNFSPFNILFCGLLPYVVSSIFCFVVYYAPVISFKLDIKVKFI